MTSTGTLTVQGIRALLAKRAIHAEQPIAEAQVQPASLDLTLAVEAYRMPGSVLALPGERVRDLIDALALEPLDLSKAALLGRNQVFLVRLREALRLPERMAAYTNSKSSTGRIDLATRVLVDGSPRYDRIPEAFAGELWCELIPRSFDVIVRAGDSLNQAIFFTEREVLGHKSLSSLHASRPLLFDEEGPVPGERCIHDGRLVMGADLQAPIVGYVAKRSHKPLDLARIGRHAAEDFFAPLAQPRSGYLFLERDRFYILATRERVAVPADLACEMVPYDPASGEFRAHYAGFFDPGWGVTEQGMVGCKAVLEVRPHEDDLILRHRQPICAMAYERLQGATEELYGHRGHSYAQQDGPRLSKYFS